MPTDNAAEIEQALKAYQAAVEDWIAAIREDLARAAAIESVEHIDEWEQSHFKEEAARDQVEAAKTQYEGALRLKYFEFE